MKSMTGYGKANASLTDIDLEIEVKSVNSRFFDIKLYMPRELNFLEMPIRNQLKEKIKRAFVEVKINFKDKRMPSMEVDEIKLKAYWDIFHRVKVVLNTEQEISIDKVIDEPGVLNTSNESLDNPEFIGFFMSCLSEALGKQQVMAYSEGDGMRRMLQESLDRITRSMHNVMATFEVYKANLYQKYKARITEIIGEYLTEENEKRLLLETAIYIDKADIHEEFSRLEDHIKRFHAILAQDKAEDAGKTLNFIVQEMHREGNTMGSKYSTPDSFADVLIIKEEIEKIREMVQNVE